jgi:hypothetical protein
VVFIWKYIYDDYVEPYSFISHNLNINEIFPNKFQHAADDASVKNSTTELLNEQYMDAPMHQCC